MDELAQDHRKALKDNSSLRRTVGELEWELAKLREDNKSFRQALKRMGESETPVTTVATMTVSNSFLLHHKSSCPCCAFHPLPSPPRTMACSSSSMCVWSHNIHLTYHCHQMGNLLVPLHWLYEYHRPLMPYQTCRQISKAN